MGRINHERKIHFNYIPEIVNAWNSLSEEQKQIFNEFGKPYGYSGMNVLYASVYIKACQLFGEADENIFYFRKKT